MKCNNYKTEKKVWSGATNDYRILSLWFDLLEKWVFKSKENHLPSFSSFTSFYRSVGCLVWSAGSWPLSSKLEPGRRRPHASVSTRPVQEARQNAHRCGSASVIMRSSGNRLVPTSWLGERSTEWLLSLKTNTSKNVYHSNYKCKNIKLKCQPKYMMGMINTVKSLL